jgi:hypothetical protein
LKQQFTIIGVRFYYVEQLYWVSTWALFITKPSDLGYSDEGYGLPEMRVVYHEAAADHITAGGDKLFRDAALSLRDAAHEKRDSLSARIHKMLDIISDCPDEHVIIWHDLEAERHAISKALPESKAIYGSQEPELKAGLAIDFEKERIKYLATKPDISGQGCNFQYY